MGLFNIFKSQENSKNGFHALTVRDFRQLTKESVVVTFDVADDKKQFFQFKPGQYVDVEATITGEKIRRSYSICSSNLVDLSIGIKAVPHGKMSNYLTELKVGDIVNISAPKGNFISSKNDDYIVCIAAGSGITPILSILSNSTARKELFFVNKTLGQMMFTSEIMTIPNLTKHFYLTQQKEENYVFGRLTKEVFISEIKSNLAILNASVFFICGPHEMVLEIQDALKMFGVSEEKIKVELFQAKALEPLEKNVDFSGNSSLEVILDGEAVHLIMESSKKTILESLEAKGIDAPYSCRGGVCCSCKAKVLEGSVRMKVNYSLTDEEVAAGYVLTCQALPNASNIKLSFDE